ncbi:MAG TPA: TonB-dependent receptor [Flavisolibacter sp.]|nr:TonB-dependent receptor [Flavisolibacter sp.]
MRKSLCFLIGLLATMLCTLTAFSQAVTLSGTVRNNSTRENIPAVSITVKGASTGTFTDENGNFKITVSKLPATLVISSVGFATQEVTVSSASDALEVNITPASSLGQEVVVSASRAPQRILETPVTVERMSSNIIRNVPAPNYYEAIQNLKGVDLHTASLTFRTVTTRGFISSGNTRLNQLIDGMDNQAPGLNFSVGSVIGPTELDVDNIELLAGASSALYGSGGMNGTLLINSKNPFKYQGLSFNIKQGINRLNDNDNQSGPQPYYDWSVRWAKAFNNKFAFKISGQLIKATDWVADDYRNVARTNVVSKLKDGNRQTDPNYDGVNMYGDETSVNIRGLSEIIVASGTASFVQAALGLPTLPTAAQVQAFLATPAGNTAFTNFLTMDPRGIALNGFRNGLATGIIPDQAVSRTGYEERSLVDYNTLNFKGTAGLHYKITPNIEASLTSYMGTGTTVYTGQDRYSLKNLKMAQHKLEVRGSGWFVRGYTTQENAGDSYQATALGRLINEAWKPSMNTANVNGSWYPQYIGAFMQARAGGMSEVAAHQAARAFADQGRLVPGTAGFDAAADNIRSTPIIQGGAMFLDKSDLWAAEGQINITDLVRIPNDAVQIIAGTQYKQYVLNSQGTLFNDKDGRLKPSEIGAYLQVKSKELFNVLTLTGAVRYDDHTNFDGRFTPRLTAVAKVAPENFIRASYQTAYRFPTNQDQYINLPTASVTLIGLLPEFQTMYNLNTNPGYTAESVQAYRAGKNPANIAVLQRATFNADVKPESVSSYELGYKGVLAKKLFFDAYTYYNNYENFLDRVAVVQPIATGAPTDVYNSFAGTSRNLSYIQNTDRKINAFGWGLTAEYQVSKNYVLYGNVFSDKLVVNDDVVPSEERETKATGTFFNTPDYRFNLGLRNENIFKNVGFNVVYKWQDENYYEGTFATGTLPSFGMLDAQVSYKMPNTKSVIRIGGTNITNKYNQTGFGSPSVGGLYYVSYGYNIF